MEVNLAQIKKSGIKKMGHCTPLYFGGGDWSDTMKEGTLTQRLSLVFSVKGGFDICCRLGLDVLERFTNVFSLVQTLKASSKTKRETGRRDPLGRQSGPQIGSLNPSS